jgi:hypothetical protein
MSEMKFKPGDTVYAAELRITEDEVDWEVIRGHCRGYKGGTRKPVLVVDREDGRWCMAYEEDCFADELDCISRLMSRIDAIHQRCSDQWGALNVKGLDILAARPKQGEAS